MPPPPGWKPPVRKLTHKDSLRRDSLKKDSIKKLKRDTIKPVELKSASKKKNNDSIQKVLAYLQPKRKEDE